MKIKHWLVSFLISFSHIAFADTVLDEVTKSVNSVCLAPGSEGQKWDVQVLATGDVKVGLKFAGKVAADAKVALTKSEWDGVQQVLREHQQMDNASYRDCAEKITPLFLGNIKEERNISSQILNKEESELKLPISIIGGGQKVVFSPDFIIEMEEASGGGVNKKGLSIIVTPENGRLYLTEGVPVNVAIKGKNYLLEFRFNKKMQPVYTLMNQ